MKKIHFVGIGGISMSALATLLQSFGHHVQGSNDVENEQTINLKKRNIKVFVGHDEKNVEGATTVVFNSAINSSNPEIIMAKKLNLQILSRAEVLASVSKKFENVIAIAGTHGKTTTAAMVSNIFHVAQKKPTVHVGGVMKNFDCNVVIGNNEFFITEACEFKNNFLSLFPTCSAITNIESDHLDFFSSFENIQNSFQQFASQSDRVVCFLNSGISSPNISSQFCIDDQCVVDFKAELKESGKTILWATALNSNADGCFSFDVFQNQNKLGRIKLSVPCKHSVSNALCATAVALEFGIRFEKIKKGLETFCGVKRRFEKVGEINGAQVIHDYAHHPTEISSTIKGARNICRGKLWAVFQPHTFSRTLALAAEFTESLLEADRIVILPTYSAREKPIAGGDAKDLWKTVSKIDCSAKYFESFTVAKKHLENFVEKSDVVLVLGAGSVDSFMEKSEKIN